MGLSAFPSSYDFAICNEIYQGAPLRETCRSVRALGYEGLELAPHTLADDATLLSAPDRQSIKAAISASGLQFVGLHWLLVSPPGLHITSPDLAVRRNTWGYVRRAIELCGDLALDDQTRRPVMVFGSPKQRSTSPGISRKEAMATFAEELAQLASLAENRRVTLLVEAIPSSDTDVVNTLAEAVAIVEQVGSPAVQTMFDVHNATDEQASHAALLSRYAKNIRHIHVNEPDGQEPGMGSYDFGSLLGGASRIGYTGWISVEAFDFSRPPEEIAGRAIQTLRNAAAVRH